MKTLYERQKENRSRTFVLIGFFLVFLGFLGAGLDFAFVGRQVGMPIATLGAIALGGFSAYWSLHGGDQAILASTRARPIDPTNPLERKLDDVLEEMAIASGMPKPKGYVIADPDPNAFATGADPEHASIAVTEGLLAMMNREELQGVVSHEMSHVKDYDTRYMTVVAALAGAVLLLAAWSRNALWWGGGRRRSNDRDGGGGGGAIALAIWVAAAILAPIVAQIVAFAVSRQREYLADATGAELTRNPLALASALQKIGDAVAPTRSITEGVGHLCIDDPRGRSLSDDGAFAGWFSTHPPIEKRIAILREMAHQTGA